MKVTAVKGFTHHLADDLAPGAILLLVTVVVDALELLVIVFDQRMERTGSRVARLVNGCRQGLHALHNCRARGMSEKIGVYGHAETVA
ncbi:MAG: hypothetical protein HY646_00570 [Acidobacteria bacterium]|nr:hypothetical protein [Acidobacteriota bacterium]